MEMPEKEECYYEKQEPIEDVKKVWLHTLSDLNVCSKKGLVEMFDSSIGAATVLMPYGAKDTDHTDPDHGGEASGHGRKDRSDNDDVLRF